MKPATPPGPGLATPRAVRYASYLMWAGAALQAVAAVIAMLTDNLMRATFFGVFSIVAIMFWRWSARATRSAEPDTRSSAIILSALATMYVTKWRSGLEPPTVMIVFALEWLAGLAATGLLFGRGSAAYFRQYRGCGRMRRWVTASLARTRRRPAPGPGL